jgi:hypothetical protein
VKHAGRLTISCDLHRRKPRGKFIRRDLTPAPVAAEGMPRAAGAMAFALLFGNSAATC